MTANARALAPLLVLIMSTAGAVNAAPAAEDSAPAPIRGALLNPDIFSLAPGSTIRIRLVGDALATLINTSNAWEVVAQGEQLPAHVCIEQSPPLIPVAVKVTSTSPPGGQALEVILDRGSSPAPLNHLQVSLKGETLGLSLQIAYSTDATHFQPESMTQVLWQQVTADGVFRRSDLQCAPGSSRYVRLRADNAVGIELDRIDGYYQSEWLAPPEEITLGLGPMSPGPDDDSHLWPLMLADNRLPLVWLSLVPPVDGTIRRVELVRVDSAQAVSRSLAWALWTNELKTTQDPLTWHEISLDVADSADQGWAAVVKDGGSKPWEFSQPKAKAAPVWLVFPAPVEWPVVLWAGQGDTHPLETSSVDLSQVHDAGQLDDLPLRQQADDSEDRATMPAPSQQASPHLVVIAFSALACVLAALGAILLVTHRPR